MTAAVNGTGDVNRGMQVFTGIGGCSSCHEISMGHTVIGPTLKGIAVTAATRKAGLTAEEYLHESIVDPNIYVVDSFAPGIMPQVFSSTLSEQQINDLVAYLLTLN
jgi:cytochrome c2